MDYNNSTFIGRIGRDSEFKSTDKWQLLKFSLCVNVMGKEKDENGNRKDVPMWIDVAYWLKNGKELSQYLKKGSSVLVSGGVSLEEYQNRDGETKTKLVLNANMIQILDKKSPSDGSQVATKQNQNLGGPSQDEVPF